MGQALLESMKECVNQTKSSGTRKREKLLAYKTLSQLAAGRISKNYRVKSRMREYIGIRKAEVRVGEWWKAGAIRGEKIELLKK